MKNLENILRQAIFYCSAVLMFVSLLVVKYSFYPFVFYKGLAILFLIEIILAVYLVLALLKPKVRPRLNWLSGAVLVFGLISVITSITGASFNRSWWGDWERFEGTYLMLHFIAWFLILSWTIKDIKQWRKLFNLSVLAGVLVGAFGVAQFFGLRLSFLPDVARISSTLGNAAYLSAYALLNLFLSVNGYFSATAKKAKIYFLSAAFLNIAVIVLSGTRGTAIALALSALAYLAFCLFNKPIFADARHKLFFRLILGLAAAGVILLALGFTGILKNNYYLSRFFNLSFESNTIQTRFQAWQYGWEGFKENVWLGIGPENYNLIFDKHLQPIIYQISGQEIWYSRAHNKIVDVAVMTGIFGLMAYLLIFVLAFIYLRKFKQQGKIGLNDYLLLNLLLIGYFINNLFLFDNHSTYLIFFLLLAFLSSLNQPPALTAPAIINESFSQAKKVFVVAASAVSLAIIAFFGWFNFRFTQANYYLLTGILSGYRLEFGGFASNFEKALKITPNYIQLVDLYAVNFNDNLAGINILGKDKDFFINALEKLLAWHHKINRLDPKYVYNAFQELKTLGNLYDLTQDDKYLVLMDALINKAVVFSPNQIRLYWVQFNYYFQKGDFAKQKEALNKAIAIAPEVADNYWFEALMYFHQKMEDEGFKAADKAIDYHYNFKLVADIQMILPHYVKNNDYPRTVRLLTNLIDAIPGQNEVYFQLAQVYAAMGNYDQAVDTLKKLASRDPAMTDNVVQAIKDLTNPGD